jgi:hypothetical protein
MRYKTINRMVNDMPVRVYHPETNREVSGEFDDTDMSLEAKIHFGRLALAGDIETVTDKAETIKGVK